MTISKFNIRDIIDVKITQLNKLIEILPLTENPDCILFKFSLSDIDTKEKSDTLREKIITSCNSRGQSFIYLFHWKDNLVSPAMLSRLLQEKKNKSKIKKTIKNRISYPQVNVIANTNCLYVGKSKNDFSSRLNHHFGYGNNHLSSMKLVKWCNLKEFKLELTVLCFPREIGQDVIRILEDGLWKKHTPLLGQNA